MRKIISARMTEATHPIPHLRLTADLKIDALNHLRKELQRCNPDLRLSLNGLLVKACAIALIEHIQWVEGKIHQYRKVGTSVVMAVAGGLSTPIIRRAEWKTVWETSREVKEFALRTAGDVLKINEILGRPFSVSNLGMYGVNQFDAIVNPPQCAILAIGCAEPRCVVSQGRRTYCARRCRPTIGR